MAGSVGPDDPTLAHAAESEEAAGGAGDPGARPLGAPGARVGRYRLVEILGEGGFGVVWRAEQTEPVRREVAVKVIKPGMDSASVIARFEAERQALAVMDHPGIARVLDGGTTGPEFERPGLPYFVMELVRGEPITAFCDRQRLSVEERLTLFAEVCEAIQHAHMKGVIHRDVKPSNVLVAYDHEGRARPKVIDFGVAKALNQRLTERTLFTERGQLIGTPEYMSPEQAEMGGLDIDTRTDVYSLGVVLYELLTGTLPFDSKALRSAAFGEIQRIIREVEPPRPSTRLEHLSDEFAGASATTRRATTLGSVAERRRSDPRSLAVALRRDLDWIVMRCLEKDRSRRYATPLALSEEVRRYLRHEPVEAGPPSVVYRLRKFTRRHRAGLAIGGSAALLLSAGFVGTTTMYLRAERHLKATEREASISRAVVEFLSDELLGSPLSGDSAVKANTTVLDAARRGAESLEGRFADPLVEAAIREAIGRVLCSFGELTAGIEEVRAAVAIRTQQLGERHQATLATRRTLGVLLNWQGDYHAAEAEFAATARAVQASMGEGDDTHLWILKQLAAVIERQGRLDEALAIEERIRSIYTHLHGPEGAPTLAWITATAVRAQDRGQIDRAMTLHQFVADVAVRARGRHDPFSLDAAQRVSSALQSAGRLGEAEAQWRAVLALAREAGNGDAEIASMRGLGDCLHRMGRLSDAERVLLDALALEQDRSGGRSVGSFATTDLLARVLEDSGEFDRALPLRERAYERSERHLGTAHTATVSTAQALGDLYIRTRRYAAASTLMERTVASIRAARGSRHPDLARPLAVLAQARWYTGAKPEAAALFQEAVSCLDMPLRPDNGWTRWLLSWTARAQRDAGMWVEAESNSRALIGLLESSEGDSRRETFDARRDLIESVSGQGRHEDAVVMLRDLLDECATALGEDDDSTLRVMLSLGGELMANRRYAEAEAVYRRHYTAISVHNADPALTAWSLGNVAWAILHQGDDRRARDVYGEVLARRRALSRVPDAPLMWTVTTLADISRRLGAHDEAAPLYDEIVRYVRQGTPGARAFSWSAYSGLAVIREERGDHSGAVALLRELYSITMEIGPPARNWARDAARLLADLYARWNAIAPTDLLNAESQAWRERAHAIERGSDPQPDSE